MSCLPLSPQGCCQKARGKVTAVAAKPATLPCTEEKVQIRGRLVCGAIAAARDHVMVTEVAGKNNVENKRSKVQGVSSTPN